MRTEESKINLIEFFHIKFVMTAVSSAIYCKNQVLDFPEFLDDSVESFEIRELGGDVRCRRDRDNYIFSLRVFYLLLDFVHHKDRSFVAFQIGDSAVKFNPWQDVGMMFIRSDKNLLGF